MNLWAMPTEINSQALRAWGILRGGGVWQSGRRIRTAFGLNYSQALRAWKLRPFYSEARRASLSIPPGAARR
jgi:hypothetical protein